MATQTVDRTPAAPHPGKINWLAWGDDAFRRAREENKLVLVDVGAVWCHWCHVMDRTTYDDERVARLVNRDFVPVRVDRDQRPDIDSRLQRAVPVIQSQGNGWPLTVVLTPGGRVLFKATYLPPAADPRPGAAMGLVELLGRLDEFYHKGQDDFERAGEEADLRSDRLYGAAASRPGEITDQLIGQVAAGIYRGFDESFGGFGSQAGPKFPHGAAVDLCLLRAGRKHDDPLRRVATMTLEAMARGGIRDQLGGGFHRYSVDRYWHVPHFEQMAGDNAALLGNYARAFCLTGEEQFSRVARDIIRFAGEVLCDREGGGFYGSRDADVGLADDGDYFIWTLDEVRAVLAGDELDAVVRYFDIDEVGDMPDATGRNVLHVTKSVEQLSRLLNVDRDTLARRIESGRARLLEARGRRPAPFVDRTIYADWNGGFVRAFADAYKLIEPNAEWLALATRAADRVLDNCLQPDGRLAHFIPAGGTAAHGENECRVFGLLSDHAWLAWGLLGLYSINGHGRYLDAAVKLLDHVVANLQDLTNGGFFDTAAPTDATAVLARSQKMWEDSPVQSANSVACIALIEAGQYVDRPDFVEAARRALAGFAGAVNSETGLFVAGWALAADLLLHPPAHVLILGSPQETSTHSAGPTGDVFRPGPKGRKRLAGGAALGSPLPQAASPEGAQAATQSVGGLESLSSSDALLPMLRAAWSAQPAGHALTEPLDPNDPASVAQLSRLGIPSETGRQEIASGQPVAYVCAAGACRPPARSPEELKATLDNL